MQPQLPSPRGAVLDQLGIRQFLDLGSGIPTVGNVHEIAQEADPACRVLYVDIEPIVVTHSELLLADNDNASVVHADLRAPDPILDSAKTHRLLDPKQPLSLLMVDIIQFVPDSDNPWSIIAGYRERLVPGSYLAMSHFTPDGMPERMAKAVEVFMTTQEPAHPALMPRSRECSTVSNWWNLVWCTPRSGARNHRKIPATSHIIPTSTRASASFTCGE